MYYRIKLQDKDNIKIFIKKIDCCFGRLKENPISLEGIVEFNKNTIKYELIYTDKSRRLNETISGWTGIYNDAKYEAIQEVLNECLDEKVELTKTEFTKLKKIFDNANNEYKQTLSVLEKNYNDEKQELFENYNDNIKSVYSHFVDEQNKKKDEQHETIC